MQFSIKDHTTALADMARRHGVSRLDIFGSAATHKFDARRSDLDFLVVFRDDPPGGMARAYFGLLEELQQYFNRPVDLVTERSMQNPYFRQSVNENRRPIYVA